MSELCDDTVGGRTLSAQPAATQTPPPPNKYDQRLQVSVRGFGNRERFKSLGQSTK